VLNLNHAVFVAVIDVACAGTISGDVVRLFHYHYLANAIRH
jgi:hypothetical protein